MYNPNLTSVCGQSQDFPFCDGSHDQYNKEHGTQVFPLELKKDDSEVGQEKTVWVCSCGHSKSRFYFFTEHKSNLK